jgi:hypothetical protein
MQAGAGELGPAMLQWKGSFRNTVQQTSVGIGYRGLNVASGTVLLTAPDDRNMHVQIAVSGPSDQSGQLHWALAPGQCRSGSIPLMPVSTFPEIHMSQGRGDLDRTITIPLPTSGSYHVNIYTGEGSDESDVLTCAELKLERRK